MDHRPDHPQPLHYVAGFLLDDTDRVVLVRKNRPAWQAGRLNGVGGKVEPGETHRDAMRREFREEAGLDLTGRDPFATVEFDRGESQFFRCFTNREHLEEVRTVTDEAIEVHRIGGLLAPDAPIIPNLRWLLPLAAHRHVLYEPVVARER